MVMARKVMEHTARRKRKARAGVGVMNCESDAHRVLLPDVFKLAAQYAACDARDKQLHRQGLKYTVGDATVKDTGHGKWDTRHVARKHALWTIAARVGRVDYLRRSCPPTAYD